MPIQAPAFRTPSINSGLVSALSRRRENPFDDIIQTAFRAGLQNQFQKQQAEQRQEHALERQRLSSELLEDRQFRRDRLTGTVVEANPITRALLEETGRKGVETVTHEGKEFLPGALVQEARAERQREQDRNKPTNITNPRTGKNYTRGELTEIQQTGLQSEFVVPGQIQPMIDQARQFNMPELASQLEDAKRQAQEDGFVSLGESQRAESTFQRAIELQETRSRLAATGASDRRIRANAASALFGAEIWDEDQGRYRSLREDEFNEQMLLLTNPQALRQQVGREGLNKALEDQSGIRLSDQQPSLGQSRAAFDEAVSKMANPREGDNMITMGVARETVRQLAEANPAVQEWVERTFPEGMGQTHFESFWTSNRSKPFRSAWLLTRRLGHETYDSYLEAKRHGLPNAPPMTDGELRAANFIMPGFGYDPERDPRQDGSFLRAQDREIEGALGNFQSRPKGPQEGPSASETRDNRRRFGRVAATARQGFVGTVMNRLRASADPEQASQEAFKRYSAMRTRPDSVKVEFENTARNIKQRISEDQFSPENVSAQRRRAEIYERLAQLIEEEPNLAPMAVNQIFIPGLQEAEDLLGVSGSERQSVLDRAASNPAQSLNQLDTILQDQ